MMYARQLENAWRSIPKPRPIVDPAWAAERRREFLESEAERLKGTMLQTKIDLGKAIKRGDEFTEACETDRLTDIQRQLEKIQKALAFLSAPPKNDKITDEMIARARNFPIKELIGTSKDQIACPLGTHPDKRASGSIRKGFFYCFTCGANLNAIDWLIKVNGFTFVDAVRKLAGA